MQGELLIHKGSHDEAERKLRASLAMAREQVAPLFELRAGRALAQLLEGRQRAGEGRRLLAEVVARAPVALLDRPEGREIRQRLSLPG